MSNQNSRRTVLVTHSFNLVSLTPFDIPSLKSKKSKVHSLETEQDNKVIPSCGNRKALFSDDKFQCTNITSIDRDVQEFVIKM